jgi:ACR3 family arsenite efflux pump ArsB
VSRTQYVYAIAIPLVAFLIVRTSLPQAIRRTHALSFENTRSNIR